MNLKRTVLISASLFFLGSIAAQADTPALYWGIGYSDVSFTTSPDPITTIKAELGTPGLALKGGVTLRDWVGIEIQYGFAKESNTQPYGLGDSLEIQQGAAFARFSLPFPRVNLYALGGVAILDVDTGAQSADDNFYAAGLGLDLMASETSMLYVELLRYVHEDRESDDPYMDVLTLGYKHHFEFVGFR